MERRPYLRLMSPAGDGADWDACACAYHRLARGELIDLRTAGETEQPDHARRCLADLLMETTRAQSRGDYAEAVQMAARVQSVAILHGQQCLRLWKRAQGRAAGQSSR